MNNPAVELALITSHCLLFYSSLVQGRPIDKCKTVHAVYGTGFKHMAGKEGRLYLELAHPATRQKS